MLFVGGEFYYDRRWMMDTRTAFPTDGERTCFLAGGQACLMVISDYLLGQGLHSVLLPAYLCPTIPKTLLRSGLRCSFYRVHEDFSIDLDDLKGRLSADPHQVVYFINYFGFSPLPPILDFFRSLRQNGTIIVEDNAQAGFHNHPTGDFVFNSLRKFAPYDGAYLNAPVDMAPYLNQYGSRPNRRLPLIREYRERLFHYLFEDEDDADELDALFEQAEQVYETDPVVLGDPQEQTCIERLDWQAIRQVRRENYNYLLSRIGEIPHIAAVFPALQTDNMPLGLPVVFSGVSRDRVAAQLGESQIGLTVHWENMHPDASTPAQRLAMDMSNRILTLAIDQYTSTKQLDYQVEQLSIAIEVAKLD